MIDMRTKNRLPVPQQDLDCLISNFVRDLEDVVNQAAREAVEQVLGRGDGAKRLTAKPKAILARQPVVKQLKHPVVKQLAKQLAKQAANLSRSQKLLQPGE